MKKGFTLIELLMVFAITLLIARSVFVTATNFITRNSVNFAVSELRRYLVSTRNYAVSSQLATGSPGNLDFVRFVGNFSTGTTGVVGANENGTGAAYVDKIMDLTNMSITQSATPLDFEVYTGKSVIGSGSVVTPRTTDITFTITYTDPITSAVTTRYVYVRSSGLIE